MTSLFPLLPTHLMDGLGNDFLIIDARPHPFTLTSQQVQQLSSRENRHTGGCDQLILLQSAIHEDVFMRIYNADGQEVEACGNATRCVGWLMLKETAKSEISIATVAGTLLAQRSEQKDSVIVNMGQPRLSWQHIPLGWECDTLHLGLEADELKGGVAVSMGNPHVVFFTEKVVATINLRELAPQVQQWSREGKRLFPHGVNVGLARVLNPSEIELRVYERGVGETLACGTGACAAAVAAIRQSLTKSTVTLHLRGGDMQVSWEAPAPVMMSGAVRHTAELRLSLQEMLAI